MTDFKDVDKHYNTCFSDEKISIKDCFERSKKLAQEKSYSGVLLDNKDCRRLVFLCEALSELKRESKEIIENVLFSAGIPTHKCTEIAEIILTDLRFK